MRGPGIEAMDARLDPPQTPKPSENCRHTGWVKVIALPANRSRRLKPTTPAWA